MSLIETAIHQGLSMEQRLAELGLNRESLEKVAKVASGAKNDSTANDPANAPGTFSYIYGTRTLREEFVGEEWAIDQTESVEAIQNEKLQIRVIFQNVDVACVEDITPRPRSRKGAGSERVCQGNIFPEFPMPEENGHATYYLMLAQDGAFELSQPIVRRGKFDEFVERIFIATEDPLDIDISGDKSTEAVNDLDIDVTRKNQK